MIERFTSQDGHPTLIQALNSQSTLFGEGSLVEAICDQAEVLGFAPDETIIEEAAPSNEIYFIVSGTVSIRVRDREIAVRTAGQHIGEMSVLDPSQRRSASAVADGEVVVARVTAAAFSKIADSFPQLWKNIARELASRLRQRNRYVLPRNPRPVLFVGCSTEALDVGREIQTVLDHDPIIVKVWTDGIFKAGNFPVESLEQELQVADFAALVLSPDDTVISRDVATDAPRDNILLELGFFMGALSRLRTFLLVPREVDVKIPTDLAGITPLTYKSEVQPVTAAAVVGACNEMRKLILAAGPR